MVGSPTVSPSSMRRSASTRTATSKTRCFQEVADSLGVLLEEEHGVAWLDVLREHESRDIRVLCADPPHRHEQ